MIKQGGLSERHAFWLKHLRACADGSLKEYAAANGLNLRALYDAKARLKRKGLLRATPARLVRVERAEPGAGAALCRVHLRNGTLVEVACAPEHWSALLASVATLP
ncbi:MAG: hypothetical protein RKL32_17295 [Gammaproteobacteria bacterium]